MKIAQRLTTNHFEQGKTACYWWQPTLPPGSLHHGFPFFAHFPEAVQTRGRRRVEPVYQPSRSVLPEGCQRALSLHFFPCGLRKLTGKNEII